MISVRNIGRKVAFSALLTIVVVAAFALITDLRAVGDQLAAFNWASLWAILGWTIFNYVLRWLKWDVYLRKLHMGHGVGYFDSGLMFTSGMVMAVTPGKVGEVLKSFLLRRVNGTPVSSSAPIVFGERLTDGLAMLVLMAAGLNLYPPARPLFWVLLLLGFAAIVALQYRPLANWLLGRAERLPFASRFSRQLYEFYQTSFELLRWRLLLVTTLLSIVSWAGECVAFYYVLTGFGIAPGLDLLLIATFVFAASTLFGLISFLPGGLGTSEASSVVLLMALVPGITLPVATAATVMIRFCTLWFGVSLGLIALAIFERRYRAADDPSDLAVADGAS